MKRICYHTISKVIDSRSSLNNRVHKVRRRECTECGTRFTTVEISMEHAAAIKRADYDMFLNRKIERGLKLAGENGTSSTAS
jgi:transcriptional regulator NrdR family protein